jgi:hypothetical protein
MAARCEGVGVRGKTQHRLCRPALHSDTGVEVDRTAIEKVRSGLSTLADTDEADAVRLANSVRNVERQKFDRFLPRPLLVVGFASDRIAPDGEGSISKAG